MDDPGAISQVLVLRQQDEAEEVEEVGVCALPTIHVA